MRIGRIGSKVFYLDASAIVKRYVLEKGSEFVDHVISHRKPLSTTRLSYVEIHSALARKKREGMLTASDHAAVTRQFEEEFEAFGRIELRPDILSAARDLLVRHPLRALDAIHLASALRVAKQLGRGVVFLGADRRLLGAAEAEGLRALDVERADQSKVALE